MSVAAGRAGLVHAAVIGDDPEEVVARCLPELRRAVAGGREVDVFADRRHGRLFREALPDAGMRFPSPIDHEAGGLVHRLPGRDDLGAVVGTACADTVGAEGYGAGLLVEDTLGLLLAEIDLTVICLYDPADAVGVQVARRTHPWLLTEQGRVVNTEYRPPATSSAVPGTLVGPVLWQASVADGTQLAGMRSQIAQRAHAEGLDQEQVDETVLAAHEGLLVAGGAPLGGTRAPDLPPGDHGVVLRRARHGIVAECRGTPPDGEGRAEQGDRLVALSRLYDGLTVHDHADGRLVRVLLRQR